MKRNKDYFKTVVRFFNTTALSSKCSNLELSFFITTFLFKNINFLVLQAKGQ